MVGNCWATLTGHVDWQYQKLAAAHSIPHWMGVTGVSNQISIQPKISLHLVKAEIEAALARHTKSDANKISVEVHGNNVTLRGVASSWSERDSQSAPRGQPSEHTMSSTK